MPLARFPSINVYHFSSSIVIAFTRWHIFWPRWLRRSIRRKNWLSSYVGLFSVVTFTRYDAGSGWGSKLIESLLIRVGPRSVHLRVIS